jgi:hypothetical protein
VSDEEVMSLEVEFWRDSRDEEVEAVGVAVGTVGLSGRSGEGGGGGNVEIDCRDDEGFRVLRDNGGGLNVDLAGLTVVRCGLAALTNALLLTTAPGEFLRFGSTFSSDWTVILGGVSSMVSFKPFP